MVPDRPHPPGADARLSGWIDLRGKTLQELEELAIRAAFERHAGNRRRMMAELGISKSSLLRKLDALGLRRGERESSNDEGGG